MRYLLFSGNYKVFDGILTCLLSVAKRTDTKEPVTAFVLTMDVSYIKKDYVPVSDAQIDFLQGVMRAYNPRNAVKKIDVSELYATEFWRCPNEGAYCSPYTLLRLFADEIEEIPDKILYLDADVMFNRDFTLLYDIDVSNVEYAAARDHYGKYLLYYNYINAGVLLLNMKMIRQTGALKKARELIKSRKLLFADQSAIIRSTTKKKMLPQKFNDQKFLHKSTVVRHFSKRLFYFPFPHTDNIKQWHVEKVHSVFRYHEFDDILEEYLALKAKFEDGGGVGVSGAENGGGVRRVISNEA
ncbi:MAG: glycosyltransferase [Candidatus Scatosoma sp.]